MEYYNTLDYFIDHRNATFLLKIPIPAMQHSIDTMILTTFVTCVC